MSQLKTENSQAATEATVEFPAIGIAVRHTKKGPYVIKPTADGAVIAKPDGTQHMIASGRCSCSGFRFRQTCKHLTWIPKWTGKQSTK